MTFARRTARLAPGLALVAGLAVILGVMILLPSYSDPRFAPLGPVMSFSAALGNAVAAAIFFATWRHENRRSTFVLAVAFAVNASVMGVFLLVTRSLSAAPPMLWSPAQTAVWLNVMAHITAGVGALCYLRVRGFDEIAPLSRRFVIAASVLGALAFTACLAAAAVLGALVPIVSEPSLTGVATSGVGPIVGAFLIFVAFRTFAVRESSIIDRALTLALLALALDILLEPFTVRFSASFYLGRALLVLGGAFVLVAAFRTLLLAQVRLREVENESSKRAGRIRSVWEIASSTARPDGDRHDSILGIATAAIRPGMSMFGTLSHLEGDRIVIDATSWRGSESDPGGFSAVVYPGASFPRESLMHNRLVGTGRSMAWNDLNLSDGRGPELDTIDLRSFIGAEVPVGRQTHFIAFGSPESMLKEPFVDDDLAYVDVVASFFASSFTQEQQFERIQFQIEHDALTGLHNRVQFRHAMRDDIRAGLPFTLAFIDLDGFRHINTRHGHQVGDELLVEVAAALGSVCANDVVARMSADEFGIMLRGARSPGGDASRVEFYADPFSRPFHTGDREGRHLLSIGASIGAARYPQDAATAEELTRKADIALKVAKTRGGSCTMMFDEPMGAVLEESDLRVVELMTAIAQDQLALVYQPTFDLATREITGAEALVRWDHPERGRLPPADFIEFAERNLLIAGITRWVFRRIVRDLASVRVLPNGAKIYFNVSAQMLDDIDFITELNEALRRDAHLVDRLGIEVTETAAMQNVERSMNTIDLFRKWGISVAIDDFGTGYSSLSYLKQLKVDIIKIDRSFVTGLPTDERDTAVAEMLLKIIDRFGVATLAEGIETEAQAAWLLEHGCRYGQGFLVARPKSFDEMLERMGVTHAA